MMDTSEVIETAATQKVIEKNRLDSWFESLLERRRPTRADFDDASRLLLEWTKEPKCAENPRLYFILRTLNRVDLLQQLIDAQITDFWIPFSKPLVKRVLEKRYQSQFLGAQKLCLDEGLPLSLHAQHMSFEDSDCMALEEVKLLGSGGWGEVHHVQHCFTRKVYARKVMSRPMDFKRHCELMKNFRRDVMGMRRVRHRHCVDLVASCSDVDSVVLLSSPVADMDLAAFLDLNLSILQLGVLRRATGCITSALAYLHRLNIRHDDLKPNNILIHRSNVLLTDFGFCLDFSDSASSTTAGAPTHRSQRYSAPEVFDHQPRSRSTDVWGLGCVLIEIVSRLRGYKLSTMKRFWCSSGIQYDSFAENPEATAAWLTKLTRSETKTQHGTDRRDTFLLSFAYHNLLERDRLLRPTAEQVLDKLQDLDFIYPVETSQCWVGECCRTNTDPSISSGPLGGIIPQWPNLDLMLLDNHLAYLFLDMNMDVFAHSKNLPLLENFSGSGAEMLRRILASDFERKHLSQAARAMLTWHHLQDHHRADLASLASQALKSISIGQMRGTSYWVDIFNIYLEDLELIPRIRTVQLSLHTMRLKRQPNYGAPFFVVTFDPEEGEIKLKEVNDPDHSNQQSRYFYREHRDVWTDGLSVAAVYLQEPEKKTYEYFQEIVSRRQRTFQKILNERRTIKMGMQTATCFRCTKHGLQCDGPQAGVCNNCQAASMPCLFDWDTIQRGGQTVKPIDERVWSSNPDPVTIRRGS